MSKHLLIVRAIAALALLPMVAVEIRANVDVVELTAEQIQSEYVAGTLSAVELTQAYLDRIATFDPTYNAFIAVYKDDALAQAAAIDAELASTGARGGLFGVPVVLKDNMDVAGKRTTAGYFGFSADAGGVDLIPSNDSTLVERLRDAGAIIIGKTNMPDFAQAGNTISSIEGQTLNAYGLDQGKMFTPGGSSGGTATAVSLSMAALGFGTETFGSIQNPSAAQGLVGFRPSFGYVPIDGILPLKASRRDVAGPMAKTVYDAAAALDTIAGPTVADPRTTDAIGNAPSQPITSFLKTDALNGKRIGVFQPVWSPPLQPEVQALYQQSLTTIQDAGATLVEDVFTGTAWQDAFADNPMAGDVFRHDLEEYFSELGPTTSFETIAEFEALAGFPLGQGSAFEPRALGAVANSIPGDIYDDPGFIAELLWQQQLLDTYVALLEAKDVDALIYPYSFLPVPELGEGNNVPLAVPEVSLMGIPLITVPVDEYQSGAPFSLTVIGSDKWTDGEIAGYAYALEQAFLAAGKGRYAPVAVPEPASLALLAVGLLALARRRT